MRLVEAVVLGLVQGLTEFLPVSSSAHLLLVPEALGWDDPGASFTAVVQLGTVAAVLLAFRRDLTELATAALRGVTDVQVRRSPPWRLARQLVLGTVPIAVIGLLLRPVIEGPLRNVGVIVVALLAGSAWLWFTTRRSGTGAVADLSDGKAWLVGLAQATALVPGVSRSGATIGAGWLLGLSPAAAARFSFLLSVPAVVLSGVFGLRDLGGDLSVGPTSVAAVVAFGSGYLTIRWLLRLVGQGRLLGFIVYRIVLAVVVAAAAITS